MSETKSVPGQNFKQKDNRLLALFHQNTPIILDGAMGTMIQKAGLPKLRHPELHNYYSPREIYSIHDKYIKAGADLIYANTFGASPSRFENEEKTYEEIIFGGVSLAKAAALETDAKVALDLGPLGVLMEPMGNTSFQQAYEEFAAMVKAGVFAGADLIAIETMSDLQEARAALLAAKENSDLPVMVTMTFEENGRTFSGTSVEAAAMTLEGLGADAIGINCSLGPAQLAPLIQRMSQAASLPIIAKPNAGLPDPMDGHYHLSDDEFLEAAKDLIEAGASIIGGCCGTTPQTISRLASLKGQPVRKAGLPLYGICSARKVCDADGIKVVGERINPTGKKRLQQALLEEDLDYIARLAIEQKEAGADLLDVNVGHPGVDEVRMLPRVIQTIESVCDLPLLLDSSNPEALEAGLRIACGRAAINSVNGSKESMEAVFPLAAKYGSPVVALCLDENGIPDSAEKRLEIARRIKNKAAEYGIPAQKLWFDALTLTVSAQQDQAMESLKTISVLSQKLSLPTILGVSNISFGLPQRSVMTQTFLAAALQAGLNFAIINPSLEPLMNTIASMKVIRNLDQGCREYVERFSAQSNETSVPVSKPKSELSLEDAVYKGLAHEAAQAAKALLAQGESEFDLTQNRLIPALDRTGLDYEKGILYLPSLLQAASAAQAVFDVIRESLARSGQTKESRGTIALATVQGDIHDIGKNIVKTLLENYGFTVVDLGRDVPVQTIVEAVESQNIPLVGLSALMTTTLPAMEQTIAALQKLPSPPKIMVGGAVLTEDAAKSMKADWYAADARESVRIAEEFFKQEGK